MPPYPENRKGAFRRPASYVRAAWWQGLNGRARHGARPVSGSAAPVRLLISPNSRFRELGPTHPPTTRCLLNGASQSCQPIPSANPVRQPNAQTAYLADQNFIMARRFGRRRPCSDGAHVLSSSRAGAWFCASSSYRIAGRRRRPGRGRYTRARSDASRARPRTASRPGGRPRKPSRLRAPQPVPRR